MTAGLAFGRISSPPHPATHARVGRLLRRGVPINSARKCAGALAHVRAGPRGNALGPQGECAVVIGHLRARQVAGKTAFLDERSAQRVGWKGLAFSDGTRNSCPTIGFDITRFSATTCNRWPGPLLDTWTGLGGGVWAPGFRPNVVEHTMLAPSRKVVSGRGRIVSNLLRRAGVRRGTGGCGLGKLFRPKKRGSGLRGQRSGVRTWSSTYTRGS